MKPLHKKLTDSKRITKAKRLIKKGVSAREIMETVFVIPWKKWVEVSDKYPKIERYLKGNFVISKKTFQTNDTLPEYIQGHLSPEASFLWERLKRGHTGKESGYDRYLKEFSKSNKTFKQQMFIHAMISCAFNASRACKIIGLSYREVEKWIKYDLDFRNLLDEVQTHKKNFVESALIRLVDAGDSPAVIFANKTLNKDRGYSERVDIVNSGSVAHSLSLEDLDLPLEDQIRIRDAIRKKKGLEIEDAEFTPIETSKK